MNRLLWVFKNYVFLEGPIIYLTVPQEYTDMCNDIYGNSTLVDEFKLNHQENQWFISGHLELPMDYDEIEMMLKILFAIHILDLIFYQATYSRLDMWKVVDPKKRLKWSTTGQRWRIG
jgi:hypothetical protein